MPDHKIKELIRKYLNGTITLEEEQLLDQWYASLGHKEDIYLSEAQSKRLRRKLWKEVQIKAVGAEGNIIKWPTFLRVAAAVTAITAISLYGILWYDESPSAGQQHMAFTNIINGSKDDMLISLPDQSKVTLSPGSRLVYNTNFNEKERKISLSGRASFEITHNPGKPFYVLTNEVITKVLGTSFSVTAFPQEAEVTVAVKTGRVSVFTNYDGAEQSAEEKNIILTSNHQLVYSRSEKKVQRTLVEEPEIIPEVEPRKTIRFEASPVTRVFGTLEEMYGIDIVFDEKALSGCFITTSIGEEEFYQRIDMICKIIGATYSLEDTSIVIHGNGCN